MIDGPVGECGDASDPPAVMADSVASQLCECVDPAPSILLTSWGGSVKEGVAIHDLIRADGRPFTIRVRRIAASAGALIAMAGSRIEIEADALLMIHSAWMFVVCDGIRPAIAARAIDDANRETAVRFARVTGRSADEELARLQLGADYWLDSRQALAHRYVHAIVPPQYGWYP